jgi:hypothetical protein
MSLPHQWGRFAFLYCILGGNWHVTIFINDSFRHVSIVLILPIAMSLLYQWRQGHVTYVLIVQLVSLYRITSGSGRVVIESDSWHVTPW